MTYYWLHLQITPSRSNTNILRFLERKKSINPKMPLQTQVNKWQRFHAAEPTKHITNFKMLRKCIQASQSILLTMLQRPSVRICVRWRRKIQMQAHRQRQVDVKKCSIKIPKYKVTHTVSNELREQSEPGHRKPRRADTGTKQATNHRFRAINK